MNLINIGVLDEHDLFRESLASLIRSDLNFQISFSCSNHQDVDRYLCEEQVHLLVVDPGRYKEESLTLIKQKTREFPSLKVMILSDKIDKDFVFKLIESGVSGIYSKKTTPAKFVLAVNEILENQFQFDVKLGPHIREKLVSAEIGVSRYTQAVEITFSARELQILDLICQERTNQEISEILSLSVRTIETHRRRMIEKTDSKNMIGVVMYAFEKHLIRRQERKIA